MYPPAPPKNHAGLCIFITKIVLRIYSIYIYISIVFIYIVFITTVRESLCLLSIRKCLVLSVILFYMFHRGRVGNVLSIPLYVLTCKEIDNKATLTFDFDYYTCDIYT